MRNVRKKKSLALLLVILFVGIGLGGILLVDVDNTSTGGGDDPLGLEYDILLVADAKQADDTWELTRWAWDETDATVADIGNDLYLGPFSKAAFQDATIKGVMTLIVFPKGSTVFSSVDIDVVCDADYDYNDMIPATSSGDMWTANWDTTQGPDGTYTVTIKGVSEASHYTLSIFSILFDGGEGNPFEKFDPMLMLTVSLVMLGVAALILRKRR